MLLVIFDVKIQQCALALKGALVGIGLFEYALKSFWLTIIGSDVASTPTSVVPTSGRQNATPKLQRYLTVDVRVTDLQQIDDKQQDLSTFRD
ncbi:hypothetical protein CEP53_010102 [Fusarium sp. AF-6]|nr:hypothetical protein CEP53_010102 [Fusarium sp. AF-6]